MYCVVDDFPVTESLSLRIAVVRKGYGGYSY